MTRSACVGFRNLQSGTGVHHAMIRVYEVALNLAQFLIPAIVIAWADRRRAETQAR